MRLFGTSPVTLSRAVRLLNQFGAKTCEFCLADRAGFLESFQLLDLIGDAESHDSPQFIACLLSLLAAPLRHAPSLGDHVHEQAEIRENKETYDPERFAPTGNILAPEQVTKDDNEQPEPYDEQEYRDNVG